jgi:hypothetical protein
MYAGANVQLNNKTENFIAKNCLLKAVNLSLQQ